MDRVNPLFPPPESKQQGTLNGVPWFFLLPIREPYQVTFRANWNWRGSNAAVDFPA